jgi:hypothetical protein
VLCALLRWQQLNARAANLVRVHRASGWVQRMHTHACAHCVWLLPCCHTRSVERCSMGPMQQQKAIQSVMQDFQVGTGMTAGCEINNDRSSVKHCTFWCDQHTGVFWSPPSLACVSLHCVSQERFQRCAMRCQDDARVRHSAAAPVTMSVSLPFYGAGQLRLRLRFLIRMWSTEHRLTLLSQRLQRLHHLVILGRKWRALTLHPHRSSVPR